MRNYIFYQSTNDDLVENYEKKHKIKAFILKLETYLRCYLSKIKIKFSL